MSVSGFLLRYFPSEIWAQIRQRTSLFMTVFFALSKVVEADEVALVSTGAGAVAVSVVAAAGNACASGVSPAVVAKVGTWKSDV